MDEEILIEETDLNEMEMDIEMNPKFGEGEEGTTDYSKLKNKPSINSVELIGNKTLEDLGAAEKINTGNKVRLSIDDNFLMKLELLNSTDEILSTATIDFPIESMIINASYANGIITLTLQNGETLDVSIGDLVNGLVSESTFNSTIEEINGRIENNTTEIEALKTSKVDKVEGKGLSTNDFTNEDKDKLDRLENYNDAEIKKSIADIQKEQTTQNEDISSIKEINTKQDELIAKLRNNQFNLVAEGTSINVQDSSDLPSVLEVSGGERQIVSTGKNKIGFQNQTIEINGLTITFDEDGTITINGTSTAGVNERWLVLKDVKKYKTNTSYAWQGKYVSGSFNTETFLTINLRSGQIETSTSEQIYSGNLSFSKSNNYTASKVAISPGTEGYLTGIQIMCYQDITFNNLKIRFQLEEGTEATEIEPYTNGIPAPSPNYRSEVETVEGNLEINKVNKNWIDLDLLPYSEKSSDLNGTVVTEIEDGKLYIDATNTIDSGTVKSKSIYTKELILKKGKYISNVRLNTRTLKDDTFIQYNTSIVDVKEDSYILQWYKFLKKGEKIILSPQLELNSVQTDYAPHESEVYNLAIQQPMLSGDTFVKEDGHWFEVHEWDKYVLTGDETILLADNVNGIAQFEILGFENVNFDYSNNVIYTLSNNYLGVPYVNSWLKDNTIIARSGRSIRIHTSEQLTVEEFKTFLAERYNAGNPVYVYYKLATLTKLPCTPEQTVVLEQLYNMDTYRPVTNVFTQEDLANLKLNYVADSKIYVDNKINAMQANLDTINQLLSTTGTSSILLSNLQTDLESEVM